MTPPDHQAPHGAIIDRQVAVEAEALPSQAALERWVDGVLARHPSQAGAELTVRFVTPDESQTLNRDYRGRDKSTNVLSFPFEAPPGIPLELLGDLVICHAVVNDEACHQRKALDEHYAHMVVHGTLHLLGYDHIEDDEADNMEQLERDILAGFGISDPYASGG
ncbi:rRNA maturation RNase YbeY [Vreelandella jeotgali]|uniref:rRNA maturation RNase YbeY n=1 Tax=Vreelandella jeotgali TaxID=553386 RepID=UPI00034C1D4A|nr:rRNA maturation RNase YbeY [Halomonas jeotgali]